MVCFDIACQVDSTVAWYPPINTYKKMWFLPTIDHFPRKIFVKTAAVLVYPRINVERTFP